jgi:hypothetical protein
MRYVVIVLILVFPAVSSAFDPWSLEDVSRHVVFSQLKLIDCLQTLKIARDQDRYYERNPILGEHPEQWQVAAFFISSYLVETAAVHAMPSSWRPWAQYLLIGVSGACVANNLSIGLGFGF